MFDPPPAPPYKGRERVAGVARPKTNQPLAGPNCFAGTTEALRTERPAVLHRACRCCRLCGLHQGQCGFACLDQIAEVC